MRPRVSVPFRIMCAGVALIFGYMAASVAVTGKFSARKKVVELSPLMRCIPVGVFGLMSAVAGWVAVTGRE